MGLLAVIVVGLAAPVAAQSPMSLRATMLYGSEHAAGDRVQRAAPLQVVERRVIERRDDAVPVTSPPDSLADPWIGRDKLLHATGSFLLTLSAQYVLTSKLDRSEDGAVPVAAGVAFSLGLAKEVADSRRPANPLFSVRDLTADTFGVALAVGLILL